MMSKTLHTKFGTAKISKNAYYRIISEKEGNYSKYLHRLIWEDFYGCEVPKGYVIHHRNHIKTDNCILNLQLMKNSDHNKLHKKDVPLSGETKQKISKSKKNKYASIKKNGFNKRGEQTYALKFNGKVLKQSINPNKLLGYFLENYPLEIIKIPEWLDQE